MKSLAMPRWIKGLLVASLAIGAMMTMVVVTSWPMFFVTDSQELTGLRFEMQKVKFISEGGREGFRTTIYRIPNTAVAEIKSDLRRLKSYPMWSALWFDGYKQARWQTFSELSKISNGRVVANVFHDISVEGEIDLASVETRADVARYARALLNDPSTLVSGWYTLSGDVVTNYFIYVLDLKQGVIVKLSLIT